MKIVSKVMLVLLLLTMAASAKKRDPLTEAETDELRQTALEPDKRVKLLISFTEARLNAIDQIRVDPKLGDTRGSRIHDLLEDFTSLLDEIRILVPEYTKVPVLKDFPDRLRL